MRTDAAPITRRGLQLALGFCWLIDAALQMQPFMFTHGFADDVLAASADGQPAVVAKPVTWVAGVVASHPLPWNLLFVAVQLAIALGLFFRRTVPAALALSVGWGVSVWYLGEGLGGLWGGSTWLPAGAPGAALLYVVLALAAWPTVRHRSGEAAPRWLLGVWAVYWVGGSLLQVVDGLTRGADVAASVAEGASAAPRWLGQLDFSVARSADRLSHGEILLLVALQALVGVAVLGPAVLRRVALLVGLLLSSGFWLVGQGLGNVTSGRATDLSTAPLVVLLGVAAFGATERRRYARVSSGRAADRRRVRVGLSPRAPS